MKKLRRKKLCLVQNDDAVHDVVKLPAAARSSGKQRSEKLDRGGNDDRCIPVFARQTTPRCLPFLSTAIEIAVMFHHGIAEDPTELVGCLLYDAGIGNDIVLLR